MRILMKQPLRPQRGGTILGFILGLVVGLAAAFGVAVYVSKVPVPFVDKAGLRGAGQDAVEAEKNKNWDPNSPLYGKNPARPNAPAAALPSDAPAADTGDTADATPAVTTVTLPDKDKKEAKASKDAASADPLGDLAKAKANAAAAADNKDNKDPFTYFVQAGAFRSQSDASAQRAKLAMLGWEARVTEREQGGQTMHRVRIGPFDKRAQADQIRTKLDGAGVESNLVRVQR